MEIFNIIYNNVKTIFGTVYLLAKPVVVGVYDKFAEQKGGRRKRTRKRTQKRTRKRMHRKKNRTWKKRYHK